MAAELLRAVLALLEYRTALHTVSYERMRLPLRLEPGIP